MDLLQGVTFALLVVLGLVGTLAFLRRRGLAHFDGGRRTPRKLESLERLALTPHHALHLIRYENKLLIVASAPSGCQILGPIPSDEVAPR